MSDSWLGAKKIQDVTSSLCSLPRMQDHGDVNVAVDTIQQQVEYLCDQRFSGSQSWELKHHISL